MNNICIPIIAVCMCALLAQSIPLTPTFFGQHELDSNASLDSTEGFLDCGSKGNVFGFELTNCSKAPCLIEIGKNYTMVVDMTPAKSHKSFAMKSALFNPKFEEKLLFYYKVEAPLEPGRGRFVFAWYPNVTHLGYVKLQLRIIATEVDEACIIGDVIVQ